MALAIDVGSFISARNILAETNKNGDFTIVATDTGDLTAALLDGIDGAFQQVLHGRYGGGIELATGAGGHDQSVRTLRIATGEDRIRLFLQTASGPTAGAQTHGQLIGVVTLAQAAAGGIEDVMIATEIYDVRDINEAADAAYLGTGVLFAPMSGDLAGGAAACGLGVVRSQEGARANMQQARQMQRGWLARQQRQNPNRSLGLAANGHRRAPASSIILPVAGDLLTRVGEALAGATAGDGQDGPRWVALVVQIGMAAMA